MWVFIWIVAEIKARYMTLMIQPVRHSAGVRTLRIIKGGFNLFNPVFATDLVYLETFHASLATRILAHHRHAGTMSPVRCY